MRSIRIRLLKKIAQISSEQITTDEVNKTNSVAGSPPSFIASSIYPSFIIGFGIKNVPIIDGLSKVLNNALYYSSNGQVNLNLLKNNNFNSGTTQIPSGDLKNIMEFCKLVYNNIYTNNGHNYKELLSTEQINIKIKLLDNHHSLNNLPLATSSGQLTAKLGGNLKTIIKNYLLQIK